MYVTLLLGDHWGTPELWWSWNGSGCLMTECAVLLEFLDKKLFLNSNKTYQAFCLVQSLRRCCLTQGFKVRTPTRECKCHVSPPRALHLAYHSVSILLGVLKKNSSLFKMNLSPGSLYWCHNSPKPVACTAPNKRPTRMESSWLQILYPFLLWVLYELYRRAKSDHITRFSTPLTTRNPKGASGQNSLVSAHWLAHWGSN